MVRSLQLVVREGARGVIEVAITSDDPAAGIQETGGVIRMGSRLMTVPIGVEARYWKESKRRREPREIPGLFKIRARNGREFLVTRQGRDLILRFALREQVRMPAQQWLSKALVSLGDVVDQRAAPVYSSQLLATSKYR
jgi:hypothetical protein